MAFGRKKIEKPKSVLGLSLFRFDNIFNVRLRNFIKSLKAKKKLNIKKTSILIQGAFYELDLILDDLSRDNFKTDYRSDKIREKIIYMINILKTNLSDAKSLTYDYEKAEEAGFFEKIDKITSLRLEIKQRMKDLESDYI